MNLGTTKMCIGWQIFIRRNLSQYFLGINYSDLYCVKGRVLRRHMVLWFHSRTSC
jgi:hypothetical protein